MKLLWTLYRPKPTLFRINFWWTSDDAFPLPALPSHPTCMFYATIHIIFTSTRRFSFGQRAKRLDFSDGSWGRMRRRKMDNSRRQNFPTIIVLSYHTLEAHVAICLFLFFKCLKVMRPRPLFAFWMTNHWTALLWIALLHKGITLTIWQSGGLLDISSVLRLCSVTLHHVILAFVRRPREITTNDKILLYDHGDKAIVKGFFYWKYK